MLKTEYMTVPNLRMAYDNKQPDVYIWRTQQCEGNLIH